MWSPSFVTMMSLPTHTSCDLCLTSFPTPWRSPYFSNSKLLYLSIRTTSLLDILLPSLFKDSLPFYKDNLPSGRSPYFSTQTLFTSLLGPPPFLTLSLTSPYTSLSQRSHSTWPTLVSRLTFPLHDILFTSSITFSLVRTLTPRHTLYFHTVTIIHTLPYVSRQSLLYILCQRWRRTSLRLHCLLSYLLAPKPLTCKQLLSHGCPLSPPCRPPGCPAWQYLQYSQHHHGAPHPILVPEIQSKIYISQINYVHVLIQLIRM